MSRPKKSKIDAALDAYYLLDDDERMSFDIIRKRVDARLGPVTLPAQAPPRRKGEKPISGEVPQG